MLTRVSSLLDSNSRGVGLVEVIIALAILGLVAAAFLNGLSTSLNAVVISDKGSTALALAQGQMEYVKGEDYSTSTWSYTVTTSGRNPIASPSWWDPPNNKPQLLSNDYAGYCAEVKAEDFDADGDGSTEVPGEDEGIRNITVTVYYNNDCTGDVVLTLEDYKVEL